MSLPLHTLCLQQLLCWWVSKRFSESILKTFFTDKLPENSAFSNSSALKHSDPVIFSSSHTNRTKGDLSFKRRITKQWKDRRFQLLICRGGIKVCDDPAVVDEQRCFLSPWNTHAATCWSPHVLSTPLQLFTVHRAQLHHTELLWSINVSWESWAL